MRNEGHVWEVAKGFFAQNGIESLDFLPALQKQLAVGLQPYPFSQDGHPNAYGYQAIAEAVAAYLESETQAPH